MFDLLQPLVQFRATLVNRLITSNLEKACYYIEMGHHEESQRHHQHAERIASKYAPHRLSDVHQFASHHEVLQ